MNKNIKVHSRSNHPICLRHTRKGIPATMVKRIKDAAKPIRHQGLLKIGASKKVISQANLTRGSTLCKQVTGCSKYEPIGSDRNKSMLFKR